VTLDAVLKRREGVKHAPTRGNGKERRWSEKKRKEKKEKKKKISSNLFAVGELQEKFAARSCSCKQREEAHGT